MEKLVRDKIIDIASNKQDFRLEISPESRFKFLLDKLIEETNEFILDKNLEELVDIETVVRALKKQLNISEEEFEHAYNKKAAERGEFDKFYALDMSSYQK